MNGRPEAEMKLWILLDKFDLAVVYKLDHFGTKYLEETHTELSMKCWVLLQIFPVVNLEGVPGADQVV